MNLSTLKSKHITVAQLLALLAFSAAILSTYKSGVFLFDNEYIYAKFENLGLEWCELIGFVHEWGLSLMLIAGIYPALGLFRNGMIRNMSLLFTFKLITVAAAVSAVTSFELMAINRHKLLTDQFPSIHFVHYSYWTYGPWYAKLVLAFGIPCAVLGWIDVGGWFWNLIRNAWKSGILTTLDLLIFFSAIAAFVFVNAVHYDIGSGVSIVQQGFPTPFVTIYSIDNIPEYDVLNFGINVGVACLAFVFAIALSRWVRH